jgi:hypothetical protein
MAKFLTAVAVMACVATSAAAQTQSNSLFGPMRRGDGLVTSPPRNPYQPQYGTPPATPRAYAPRPPANPYTPPYDPRKNPYTLPSELQDDPYDLPSELQGNPYTRKIPGRSAR